MLLTRAEFINRLVRAGLFILLAIIIFALGKKIVTGRECSSCPGKDICAGESDCSTFLSEGR
jgi:hypothetical protein